MEPGKVQGRLPGSANGSDRGKSGSRRERNRRETEESPQADESNRSGFRIAEELGANRRKEKGDWQIGQETEATCKESSVRWIGFSEDDGEENRRRREYEAAKPHCLANMLRTTRFIVDIVTGLT